MLLIAVVGKPNSGKSSFFKAVTMVEVKISPVPFTTIRPNLGVAHVRVKCPDAQFGTQCSPRYGHCENGVRWLPFQLMDVAGLVPGAHEGRGIGNQFLDDLRKANCLVHVVDASGTSDFEGNPAQGHDPCDDIRFLESEIDLWFKSILEKNWAVIERRSSSEKMEAVNRITAPMYIINPMAARGSDAVSMFSTHPPTGERIKILRSMAGGAGLGDYNKAFEKTTGHEIIGANSLRSSEELEMRGIRPAAEPVNTKKQTREAIDILHRLNNFTFITCPCGLKLKIPPSFTEPTVKCPKCGTVHQVSK